MSLFTFIFILSYSINIDWYDTDSAFELALKENKIIMIYFYADWCVYCKKLEKEIFSDDSFNKKFRKKFVGIKLNAENNQTLHKFNNKIKTPKEIAELYNVSALPNILFMNENGEKIGFLNGYHDLKSFIKVLDHLEKNY